MSRLVLSLLNQIPSRVRLRKPTFRLLRPSSLDADLVPPTAVRVRLYNEDLAFPFRPTSPCLISLISFSIPFRLPAHAWPFPYRIGRVLALYLLVHLYPTLICLATHKASPSLITRASIHSGMTDQSPFHNVVVDYGNPLSPVLPSLKEYTQFFRLPTLLMLSMRNNENSTLIHEKNGLIIS